MIDLYRLYKLLERWYTGVPRLFNSGRALPPLQMVFELTYRCNLRCPMCYQRRQEKLLGVSHGKASQELDLEAIKRIIDQTPPADKRRNRPGAGGNGAALYWLLH
jgi:sulfatase maturation enzyme AslB (radical SAM superfamily)